MISGILLALPILLGIIGIAIFSAKHSQKRTIK